MQVLPTGQSLTGSSWSFNPIHGLSNIVKIAVPILLSSGIAAAARVRDEWGSEFCRNVSINLNFSFARFWWAGAKMIRMANDVIRRRPLGNYLDGIFKRRILLAKAELFQNIERGGQEVFSNLLDASVGRGICSLECNPVPEILEDYNPLTYTGGCTPLFRLDEKHYDMMCDNWLVTSCQLKKLFTSGCTAIYEQVSARGGVPEKLYNECLDAAKQVFDTAINHLNELECFYTHNDCDTITVREIKVSSFDSSEDYSDNLALKIGLLVLGLGATGYVFYRLHSRRKQQKLSTFIQ